MIGRKAIMDALDHIDVSENSAWSIASSLVLIQCDDELSFWKTATEINLHDFVADCHMCGRYGGGLTEAIQRLQEFVNVLIDFYGPDDSRATKLGSAMNRLMCAAHDGCI